MPNSTFFAFPLLITASLFLPLIFFSTSHGASDIPLLQPPSPSVLGEAPGGEPVQTAYVVLAAERTNRKDPLKGFEAYTGGWNISDRHYWASAGYTALPLFIVAAIWFLSFGLCLLVICIFYFCRRKRFYGYSKAAYVTSFILLITLSFMAIIGCVIMYTSQEKFHSSMMTTLESIVTQADATAGKLREISGHLGESKQIEVDHVTLPANIQSDIEEIGSKISASATNLADKATANSRNMQDVLDSMRVKLIIAAAAMLSLAFLGFLFSTFGMQTLVYVLVIIGWILVTGAFILCGAFLLIHTVAADSCVAIDQWVQSPAAAPTALDEILPCPNIAATQEAFSQSKEITYRIVELVNEVITNISNLDFSPDIKAVYYNASGVRIPILCNRFHSDLTDRACSRGEVDMNNAEQVLQNFTCEVSLTQPDICRTTGRLTPNMFNQMVAAVNVGNSLYNDAPFLLELQQCNFVRATFTDIVTNRCTGLRAFSRYIYIGLETIAFAVMFSVALWAVYCRERSHRVRTVSRPRVRTKSRSPVLTKSRSPIRTKSRSPIRIESRTPIRPPVRIRSRSPVRPKTHSPVRTKIRSPAPVRPRGRSAVRAKYEVDPLELEETYYPRNPSF